MNRHQASGIVVGKRMQQRGVDNAEHRGAGADSKRQAQHGGGRE